MADDLRPTLLDQLLAGVDFVGETADAHEIGRLGVGVNPAANPDEFGEAELRYTLRRELAWLLNTVQMGERTDLEAYPEVRTSVLNYGVGELIGQSLTEHVLAARARAVQAAIRAFEPRFEKDTVRVEPPKKGDSSGGAYLVTGRIRVDGASFQVSFYADLAMESGAATVRG